MGSARRIGEKSKKKAYTTALEELHRAPYERFVKERERLAAEVAKRDPTGSARFEKLRRPSVTAWAVNQLWWRERSAFQKLFATAESVRDGDLSRVRDQRKALLVLRDHAARILTEGGHGTSEAALRKVAATLSALAAQGGFGTHTSGTLPHDLESPGFSAIGDAAIDKLIARVKRGAKVSRKDDDPGPSRAELAAHRRREERERAARNAERERVEQERVVENHRRELEAGRRALSQTKARVREIEKRRRKLGS